MQECLATEHRRKLLRNAFEQLLNGSGISDERRRHLQPTWWNIANGGLHVVWNPFDEVAAVLVLHVQHLLIHFLQINQVRHALHVRIHRAPAGKTLRSLHILNKRTPTKWPKTGSLDLVKRIPFWGRLGTIPSPTKLLECIHITHQNDRWNVTMSMSYQWRPAKSSMPNMKYCLCKVTLFTFSASWIAKRHNGITNKVVQLFWQLSFMKGHATYFYGHSTAKYCSRGQITAVLRVTRSHNVATVKHLLGELADGQLLVWHWS